MSYNTSSIDTKFSKHTSFFGIRLWVLVLALIAVFTALFLVIMAACFICLCRRKFKPFNPHLRRLLNPISMKGFLNSYTIPSKDKRLLSQRVSEVEMNIEKFDHHHQVMLTDQCSNVSTGLTTRWSGTGVADLEATARYSSVVPDAWRGNRIALKEIEVVTDGFADNNMIGSGDYSVAYRGVLLDTTRVAVKRLLSNSCQAEDFIAEAEMIRHVRHKNLVKLLGYCMEEGYRILVSEYVDNGNLHQWLYGCPEQPSPLTWAIRMSIIQGIAKGYLAHEHEYTGVLSEKSDVYSFGILIMEIICARAPVDHNQPQVYLVDWLKSMIANKQIIYLAHEHEYTGVLSEKSDVYSFGILIMEIICARAPVDHNQPQVYLVDWLKSMIANKQIMFVVDPKLPEIPSSKELKRILLLALRCVDRDIKHRPTMGDVIHMLEPRDLLLDDDRRIRRDGSSCRYKQQESHIVTQFGVGAFSTHDKESNINLYQKILPT
ncbi:serine/threonine-protein kinase [Populus alba x Populus x berolinensis]|uniref:non-specific serine/threonine protein kinase n=1 Tax=Populus alba x Populus x berolinensis TaxID=444605 RepID=A0AAD6LK57_9ROSI|nr:serine/threonine-protein kinase [Populus alba x Populus x berolinensis]KAJ6960801.1 serine/threonine-protein kinase [Populus alba x Populus x berolinensis]